MNILRRIYEDFFKASRLKKYKELLETAKENGYQMMGIMDFYKATLEDGFSKNNIKILINRHDIDTSPRVAKQMFLIEKEIYGKEGSSTFYFRKKTINKKIIKMIEDFGYETGFHYETIANFEKKKKYKNLKILITHMEEIQSLFLEEISLYRLKTETRSETVSSHGDFINSQYKYQNYELLKNTEMRKKSEILLEAYDECINKLVDNRFADQVLLSDFPKAVESAIKEGNPIIQILTHPRNWKVDFMWNLKDDLTRAIEALKYKL